MARLKSVRIILLIRQEGRSIKALKKLGLVRVIDYGGSKLSVLELRVPAIH